jgi:hypothetical protein
MVVTSLPASLGAVLLVPTVVVLPSNSLPGIGICGLNSKLSGSSAKVVGTNIWKLKIIIINSSMVLIVLVIYLSYI